MSNSAFPYERHQDSDLWNRIGATLEKLKENGDLMITTEERYVIGSLAEALSKNSATRGFLSPERPDFDGTEEFLIAYYLSPQSAQEGGQNMEDWVALVVGAGILIAGVVQKVDPIWCFIGFGLVAFRFGKLLLNGSRYGKSLRGIIRKYEAVISARGSLRR